MEKILRKMFLPKGHDLRAKSAERRFIAIERRITPRPMTREDFDDRMLNSAERFCEHCPLKIMGVCTDRKCPMRPFSPVPLIELPHL